MTSVAPAMPDAVLRSEERTYKVVASLRDALVEELGEDETDVFGDHTTFILTGSGGRGEMTAGSDIDGYVVRIGREVDRLHDAKILEATARALRKEGLPELDRGGDFLAMKTDRAVIDELGSTNDDHTNAFTVRMLFLLESRPLFGEHAYDELFNLVCKAYRNTPFEHRENFQPFFLVNDIIRYWRTVLLNHEDRLRRKKKELEEEEGLSGPALSDELLAHRRYRSQKLRFPRCISCFSTLAYLLAIAPKDSDGVSIEQEREMFDRTPIRRLLHVAELCPRVKADIEEMIELYRAYLERGSTEKTEVLHLLKTDQKFQREMSDDGHRFTQKMFELIQELGQGNQLHRQMLI